MMLHVPCTCGVALHGCMSMSACLAKFFLNMISPIHLLISRSNSLVGSPMHSLAQLVTGPCCSKLACAMIIDMQPGLRPCQCKYSASFSKTSLGRTCENDNKNDKVVVRHPPGQTLLHKHKLQVHWVSNFHKSWLPMPRAKKQCLTVSLWKRSCSSHVLSDEQRANVTLDFTHFQFPSGRFTAWCVLWLIPCKTIKVQFLLLCISIPCKTIKHHFLVKPSAYSLYWKKKTKR